MLLFISVVIRVCVPLCFQIGSTAPTPTVPQHKRLVNDWTPSLAICLTVLQSSIWFHALVEGFQVIAPTLTATAAARASHLIPPYHIYISSGRLLGAAFCLMGAILRWFCYREMTHQFTFHITVMDHHKLITTGPYAYIRHPSYTGGLLLDLGLLMWHLAPGSWLRASGAWQTAIFWIFAAPSVALMCFSTRMHFWRCKVEDNIMKEEFGKKWDEWANDVPYKLFPGVF